MNQKKEGQITLFVILGILILVIMAILLYIVNYAREEKRPKNIMVAEKTPFDTAPIREYVTACLDKTAKEGLFLLGQQGGYIYKSQGGPIEDYLPMREGRFFVKYNNDAVSYNIYAPTYDIGVYYSSPPNYPWKRFPYAGGTLTGQTFQGNFGLSALPPLREEDGLHSIQEQLKTYVTNNIKKCINDFDVFTGNVFEIKEEKLSVDVTIAKTDVAANLDYPLEIKKISTGEVTEISDFYATIDIRLDELYNFTKELIINDITNIKFDIDEHRNDINQFSVSTAKDANSQGDDLVIVKDAASLIKGQPYEYRFARHNRVPALYYIPDPGSNFLENRTIKPSDITANPLAEDPDEDSFTFEFNHSITKDSLPYTIRPIDKRRKCSPQEGTPPVDLKIRVSVKDGKGMEDYQDVKIEVECT